MLFYSSCNPATVEYNAFDYEPIEDNDHYEEEDGNDEDYEDHAEAEAAGGDDDEEEDDVPKGKSIQDRDFFKLLRV